MEIEGPLPRDWGRPFGVSGETARGLALAALTLAGRRDPSRPPSLSLPRQQGRDGRLASLVTVGRCDDASPCAEFSPPSRSGGGAGGGGQPGGQSTCFSSRCFSWRLVMVSPCLPPARGVRSAPRRTGGTRADGE